MMERKLSEILFIGPGNHWAKDDLVKLFENNHHSDNDAVNRGQRGKILVQSKYLVKTAKTQNKSYFQKGYHRVEEVKQSITSGCI